MAGCNVLPKRFEDVYLNWPYRISCHSLLHVKLEPLYNNLYMEVYDEGGNWERQMTTVSMAMAQINILQYIPIC